MKLYIITFTILVWLLAACENEKITEGLPVPVAPTRQYDSGQLTLGKDVFQANCAKCHGVEGEGAPNWTKRGADGKYPAPPLNGAGHAWHHSTEVLLNIIREGSPNGQGNMPAWQGRISDQEMQAAIAWFQSKWPQPVYDAWYEMQQRGR